MALHQSLLVILSRWRYITQLSGHVRSKSTMSSSRTMTALRPFYLCVHPDFFAQHPEIQKVNETSLKRLNSYLEALQCSRQMQSLQPTKVSFYFRRNNSGSDGRYGDFRLVNFTLQSLDLMTNIEHILSSCDLPAKHLKELMEQPPRKRSTYDPSLEQRYRRTTYSAWGGIRRDDDLKEEELNSDIRLRQWLNENAAECKKQQEASRQIRQNNQTLKSNLCMELGLREITWNSPWQYTSEQGILRTFLRFSSQHSDVVRCLQGKRLVFSDRTMAGADESICLNVEDVSQQWLQFFLKYNEKFQQTYSQAKRLDEFVSKQCGNIQIVRPAVRMSRVRKYNLLSIDDYVSVLNKITTRLKSVGLDDLKLLPWSMRNLEVTFVKLHNVGDSAISLFSNGRFCVDENCDPSFLLTYLKLNKSLAQEKTFLYASDKSRADRLSSMCKEKLGIQSIMKDFDVEQHEMASCCERLLQHSTGFAIPLNGMEIRITAKYFAIFDHGCVCIPWDWKL